MQCFYYAVIILLPFIAMAATCCVLCAHRVKIITLSRPPVQNAGTKDSSHPNLNVSPESVWVCPSAVQVKAEC